MLNTTKVILSRSQKILLVMYELSNGKKINLPFAKIVVGVFNRYTKDFHLDGYPEYPDSELLNNALYHTLKKSGYIKYGNKVFSLTDKGLDYVNNIKLVIKGKSIHAQDKIERYINIEIKRIKSLDSVNNFVRGNYNLILDTDLYDYIGVTVRTEKNDFLSRLNIIKDVVSAIQKSSNKEYSTLLKYHKYMMNKFRNEIIYKSEF